MFGFFRFKMRTVLLSVSIGYSKFFYRINNRFYLADDCVVMCKYVGIMDHDLIIKYSLN